MKAISIHAGWWVLAALVPHAASGAAPIRTLEENQYSAGYCLVRPKDYVQKIIRVDDPKAWTTCAGAKLESARMPANTRCKRAADLMKGDVLHVRERGGSTELQLELTLERNGVAHFEKLPLEPGPNPHRPLWLSAPHGDFAYYLYLSDIKAADGKQSKVFWVEAFDLTSADCLDELPSMPNVVSTDCDGLTERLQFGAAHHAALAAAPLQSPVGPGPEESRLLGSCDTLPVADPGPGPEPASKDNRQ
jgi:hypothetical protein